MTAQALPQGHWPPTPDELELGRQRYAAGRCAVCDAVLVPWITREGQHEAVLLQCPNAAANRHTYEHGSWRP